MKTLFFVVSSADVLKNFFFFPGGLFDMLKDTARRENFLVVLVVPSFGEKYLERLNPAVEGYEDVIRIEMVGYPNVNTLAGATFTQKLFSFFYSYLVYTGTTKTLATMGMRLDDAPGGGKRHLAPAKWLIANTFGRSLVFKRRAVPFLYNIFYPKRAFSPLFEKYNPDFVFAPNLFKRFDEEVVREAKKRGVPTTGMAMNWDHFDKYYLPFQADELLVQSEQVKDFAIRYQAYKQSSIRVVGYPYIDFVLDKQYARPRDEMLHTLGFQKGSKYILYISGSMYCPDEPDIIETILTWIDEGKFGSNTGLVIRPYPGGRGRDIAFDTKKFEGLTRHPRVSFQADKFWIDTERSAHFMNIMRHADAVIAVYSTAVLEAVALDRPLLTPAFDGYHTRPFHRSVRRFELREHFQDVLKTGGQRRAYSFEELFLILKRYLDDPTQDKEKREALRQRTLYPADGMATERIFKYIMERMRAV